MTELTMTLWLLLAVVQQHGSIGFTFGAEADCRTLYDTLRPAPETIALSECLHVELLRLHDGQPLMKPKPAP